jgi:hypothetical protein
MDSCSKESQVLKFMATSSPLNNFHQDRLALIINKVLLSIPDSFITITIESAELKEKLYMFFKKQFIIASLSDCFEFPAKQVFRKEKIKTSKKKILIREGILIKFILFFSSD